MKRVQSVILIATVIFCCLGLRAFGDIPYLQGFESNTNDWTAYIWMDRVPSGGGPLGLPSFQGSYHAVISNQHDAYSAGLGAAGYTFFGSGVPTYTGDFYQGISLYIDATNWATGSGFWVDQSPRATNDVSANVGDFKDEQHFKFDVQTPGTVRVTFSGGASSFTITNSGWYTIMETFRSTGATTNDKVQNDFLTFDAEGNLVAARTITADTMPSTGLGGNSYLWFTVWHNGFADDILAIDNARTGYIKTWNGTGDWFANPENWTGGLPVAGDVAVIASGSVTLTNSPPALGTLLMSGGSMTFSNWTTCLTATNIAILDGAQMNLPGEFTDTQMSNRIWLACTNLTIEQGGSINADGGGFAGGGQNQAGYGPGGGKVGNYGGGGGYGGRGGWAYLGGNWKGKGGTNYGSAFQPLYPGSGGGAFNSGSAYGGDGGGAVLIECSGDVIVDGTISANGTDANYYAGGGSGGGIDITCARFGGTGSIAAEGGQKANNGGGGGGGRIAVKYGALIGTPSVRFTLREAECILPRDHYKFRWLESLWHSDPGTLYLPDTALLTQPVTNIEAHLVIPGLSPWSPASLTISNATVMLDPDFDLAVGGALTVGHNGSLELGTNSTVSAAGNVLLDGGRLAIHSFTQMVCTADLLITNGGTLNISSVASNGATTYGAQVNVSGDIGIGPSSWLLPNAHRVNGGAIRVRASNVHLAAGGGIDGTGRGYSGGIGPLTGATDGYGPGGGLGGGSAPNYGSGAGHGGQGGDSWYNDAWGRAGGPTYGKTNAPVEPGSGGGCFTSGSGGHGGGSLWIEASNEVIVDGTLSANAGEAYYYSGGGSGGGIFVATPAFSGSASGLMSADGTDRANFGGPGGGGRIAVAIGLSDAARDALIANGTLAGLNVYTSDTSYAGGVSVGVGSGPDYTGEEARAPKPGTVRFITTNLLLTVSGDPEAYGDPSPWPYGGNPYIEKNTWITNRVVSPANEASGVRRACIGWRLEDASGSVLDSAVSTQVVFQLTDTRVQWWRWTNEYQLAMSSAVATNGYVTLSSNGWYTNGQVVANLHAVPSNGYIFSEWTGDFPAGHASDNPLSVTMDQPRTIIGQFTAAGGATKYWSGTGTWDSIGNWSPPGLPGPYDHAIIQTGNVTVAISRTVRMLSVSNNASITFTNWNTSLTASNVTIRDGGVITLPAAFTNDQPSNRVWIVCTNLTIDPGGLIDADGKGFAGGGPGKPGNGEGPGLVGNYGGGGGHGGRGGWAYLPAGSTRWTGSGGSAYDSASQPTKPGSGGGAYNSASHNAHGGDGGGVIRIDAAGDVVVNGSISANGTDGHYYAGGGAGGSVYITCDRFGGAGRVSVNGGQRADYGGGGGGGRLAIDYTSLIGTPLMRFEAQEKPSLIPRWHHLLRWQTARWVAEPGTLWFADASLLSGTVTNLHGQLVISGSSAWAPGDLVISNALVQFGVGFDLDVNNLTVGSSGVLEMAAGSTLDAGGNMILDGGSLVMNVFTQMLCTGDLVLTNGGHFYAYGAATNGSAPHGSLISVGQDIRVGPASWIHPDNDRTNGGAVRFQAQNVFVSTNGGFDADGRGFSGAVGPLPGSDDGYGPGKGLGGGSGVYGSGAGYGGQGGYSWYNGSWGKAGGPAYGSSNAPVLPGSGGGSFSSGYGGHGGGTIWIEASGEARINGTLKANGGDAIYYSGGGSGGGILVSAQQFKGGSDGLLEATGSDRSDFGGPGGGGRIAVAMGLNASQYSNLLAGLPAAQLEHRSSLASFAGTNIVGVGAGPDYTGEEARAPKEGTVVLLTSALNRGTLILIR